MSEASQKRILAIDDEPDVTELICYHLRANGFNAKALNDPVHSLATVRSFKPHLIILDVMMPGFSGVQICQLLRNDPEFRAVPVIFLTARAEEADRIKGLQSGADDYVAKPFSTKELVLRIQALLRRVSGGPPPSSKPLQIGQIVVEPDRHVASVRGEPVELTATEFKLLRILMERQGRVQSREHLLLTVWRYETGIETRTVDTHVRRLREKLGPEADWIETVRGVGYRMAERRPTGVR